VVIDVPSTTQLTTSPLTGGDGNTWEDDDWYAIGEYSTHHDYIALDIFRFTKIDIDELVIEFSSLAPVADTGGACHFTRGFRCVVYTDSDYTHWDLKMRTMIAEWAMNPYGNKMFHCRFRKEWFIPIELTTLVKYVADATSTGSTLVDAGYTFSASMVGWKIDAYNAAGTAIIGSGSITAYISTTSVTCAIYSVGTADATSGSKYLYDEDAEFTADIVGQTLYNVTTGTSAVITDWNATHLHTTTAITFTAGDAYKVQKPWATGVKYVIHPVDDWATINYMKIKLQQNKQAYTQSTASITFDNIKLLKTPPMPAELKIQVATCDPLETWIGPWVTDDYVHATEGIGCKKITGVGILKWAGPKDLLHYGDDDDTSFEPGDVFTFDLGLGDVVDSSGGIFVTFVLVDTSGNSAIGKSAWWTDITKPTERSIHKQEFELIGAFDWENVDYMVVIPFLELTFYIDNIRITKPQASKMINDFLMLGLLAAGVLAEAAEMYVEAALGENPLTDQVSELIMSCVLNSQILGTGQGSFIFPDFKHGRVKLGDYSIPCLNIKASAGGAYQVIIKRGDDLTEYEIEGGTGTIATTGGTGKIIDGMMNLDSFGVPRPYAYMGQKKRSDSADTTVKTFGMTDWVEIPASDNDEFEIWMSSPNWTNVRKIIFRLYQNQNMSWMPYATGTHEGGNGEVKLHCDDKFLIIKHLWRRIRNLTTAQEGIITWVEFAGFGVESDNLQAVHTVGDNAGQTMIWNHDDEFEIEGWVFNDPTFLPEPDPNNYYEYELDVTNLTLLAENLKSMQKEAKKYANVYAEFWESAREIAREMGVWNIAKDEDTGWYSLVIRWKRGDMVAHLQNPEWGSGMQNLAGHGLTVLAGASDGEVSFQDWKMTKVGAVSGEVIYKIKLEDETGYLGPASSNSKKIGVKGSDVYLKDIYVPHDTRIKRKRIYRTDSTGEFRYLDTIDRTQTYYLDCVPVGELGNVIEPDMFEPPRAKYIEEVDNRIAYLNVIDREGRYRRSRCYLSEPFVPHMCSDEKVFDLLPENGQELRGIAYYLGYYLVWKDKCFYSVDPNNFEPVPRSPNLGLLAPETLKAVPEVGYGWLSHEGVCFGDHTDIDTVTGLEIWDDLKAIKDTYGMDILRKARAEYYYKHYILWVGINNENCYACYMPWKKWFKIEGWSAYSTAVFMGEGDNYELYAGDKLGYVNRLFYGNTDNLANISSVIRTLDYDYQSPEINKYHYGTVIGAKNLVSGASNQASLIVTPYMNNAAGTSYASQTLSSTNYLKYVYRGREKDIGNLLGIRIVGSGRYALRAISMFTESISQEPLGI